MELPANPEACRCLARLLVKTALRDAVSDEDGQREAVQRWIENWSEHPGGAAWTAETLGLRTLPLVRSLCLAGGPRRVAVRDRIRRLSWS